MPRKILLFISIIFSSLHELQAQKFEPETTVGAKFGYNISKMNFDSTVNQKLKYGYNGGLVLRYMGEKHLGIQVEFIVTQKGWEEKLNSPNIYNRRLTYFELPFLTHFEIGGNTTKFQFNIGSYFSYLFYEEKVMIINATNEIQPYYRSKVDNNLDFGLCGGIGFLQKTPIGHFEIEARFSQGLGNIFKFNHFSRISTSQNQVLSIDLTYLIKL